MSSFRISFATEKCGNCKKEVSRKLQMSIIV